MQCLGSYQPCTPSAVYSIDPCRCRNISDRPTTNSYRMSSSQPSLPTGLEVRVIHSARYASQLARVKLAAFKKNTLNIQMYPLTSNEHGTTAWLEEREAQDLASNKIATIAIINIIDDEILARVKWRVPGKFSHIPSDAAYPDRQLSEISHDQEFGKTPEQNSGLPRYPKGSNLSLQNLFRTVLQQKREKYYDAETDYCELELLCRWLFWDFRDTALVD